MWHYQHRSVRKRQLLWVKLLLISFLCHLAVLGWLFFVYRSDFEVISLTLYKKSDQLAPVFFVPYVYVEKAKIVSHAKVNVQKIAAKQEVKVKKEDIQSKVMTAQKAVVVQKEEEKKIAALEKKQIKEEPVKSKAVQSDQLNKQKSPQIPQLIQEPQHSITSANYREVEAIRRGILLQKELLKNWKPPRGMQLNCVCDITATIGTNGKIIDLKIDKSSGVLMYDISARQAFFSMSIPQWAHGKLITVSFKQ